MSNLQNKKIVVIGGSSGIGFSVALAALQSLASVVIIASSNADRVHGAVKRLKSHNLPGEVRGDVLDASDVAAVKDFAIRLGTVDHVIWSSGDIQPGMIDDNIDSISHTGLFAVRFWGPFIMAHNVKFNPGGSLTLTSGIVDIKPPPHRAAVAGMTSAIGGLAKGLAVDLAPVRVNVIAPGPTNTELFNIIPEEMRPTMMEQMKKMNILKRVAGPEEVAEAYIFVMKCGYITGQIICVDGGVAIA